MPHILHRSGVKMVRVRSRFYILIAFFIFSGINAQADVINFVWNDYCPYTCSKNSYKNPGYALEIVHAIFKNSKYKPVFTYISSWNRAMKMVKEGDADAIVFSFYNPDDRKNYIVPSESLAVSDKTSFAVRKDNPWKLKDANSLNSLGNIGVYKNTAWADKNFEKYEKLNRSKFNYLHGSNIITRAFRMLKNGRIDAWEDSETVLKFNFYKRGISNFRIESLLSSSSNPQTGDTLFTLLNPESKEYAVFLSNGIKRLRRSGELNSILKKYGLVDWKK